MTRYITLPSSRAIGLAEYVRSWRALLSMPAARLVANWSHFPQTVGEILEAIRFGIQDRINLKDPRFPRGRNAQFEAENEARHCALRVNQPRLCVRLAEIPARFRQRLAHRITYLHDL